MSSLKGNIPDLKTQDRNSPFTTNEKKRAEVLNNFVFTSELGHVSTLEKKSEESLSIWK